MNVLNATEFFKILLSQKLCSSCSRKSHKIVPLTKWNKYLHNDTSERGVNVKISVNKAEKNSKKKTLSLPVRKSKLYMLRSVRFTFTVPVCQVR